MEETVVMVWKKGTRVIGLDWEDFGLDESEVVDAFNRTPSRFHGWMARVDDRDVYIPEIVSQARQAHKSYSTV